MSEEHMTKHTENEHISKSHIWLYMPLGIDLDCQLVDGNHAGTSTRLELVYAKI